MVYLLHKYFGRDGRDEAEDMLQRRSGNPDKPRILEAFNQPCDDWLNFFCFTMFTDRDGKYQLSALAESGFEPLARTCQFMLTEEAHHLFVGERSEEHTSELQSRQYLVCRLLLEKKMHLGIASSTAWTLYDNFTLLAHDDVLCAEQLAPLAFVRIT